MQAATARCARHCLNCLSGVTSVNRPWWSRVTKASCMPASVLPGRMAMSGFSRCCPASCRSCITPWMPATASSPSRKCSPTARTLSRRPDAVRTSSASSKAGPPSLQPAIEHEPIGDVGVFRQRVVVPAPHGLNGRQADTAHRATVLRQQVHVHARLLVH
eukprot:284819055_5